MRIWAALHSFPRVPGLQRHVRQWETLLRFAWLSRDLSRIGSQIFPLSRWGFPIRASLPAVFSSLSAEFLCEMMPACTLAESVGQRARAACVKLNNDGPSRADPATGCRCKLTSRVFLKAEQDLTLKGISLSFSRQAIWNVHVSPPKPAMFCGLKTLPVSRSHLSQCSISWGSAKAYKIYGVLWISVVTNHKTFSNRKGSLPWRVRTYFSDIAMGI